MNHTLEVIVNPFGDLKSGSPDNIKQVETVDKVLSKVFETYMNYKNNRDWFSKMQAEVSSLELPVLNPDQISTFLQMVVCKKEKAVLEDDYATALFLTKFVQDSYLQLKFDNFKLNSMDVVLYGVFDGLKAVEGKPITIILNGNAGHSFGTNSRFCNYSVTGNVDSDCGQAAVSCEFNIGKSAGSYCGYRSEDSIFNINGNAVTNLGSNSVSSQFHVKGRCSGFCGMEAKYSLFNVSGDVGRFFGSRSENSTYEIGGNLGRSSAQYTRHCIFYLGRDFDEFAFAGDAHYGIFRTKDKAVYEKLKIVLEKENQTQEEHHGKAAGREVANKAELIT